jgi:hypothetical protein
VLPLRNPFRLPLLTKPRRLVERLTPRLENALPVELRLVNPFRLVFPNPLRFEPFKVRSDRFAPCDRCVDRYVELFRGREMDRLPLRNVLLDGVEKALELRRVVPRFALKVRRLVDRLLPMDRVGCPLVIPLLRDEDRNPLREPEERVMLLRPRETDRPLDRPALKLEPRLRLILRLPPPDRVARAPRWLLLRCANASGASASTSDRPRIPATMMLMPRDLRGW